MKNIESLVEEALKEINNVSVDANQVRKILTDLATKASQNGLKPLPEEMPDEIMVLIGNSFIASDVWKWFKGNFGIPPSNLQPLPEEVNNNLIEHPIPLKAGDKRVLVNGSPLQVDFRIVAEDYYQKHFGTKPREWWMDLEKGDKVIDELKGVRTFTGSIFIETGASVICDVNKCSPYTPTALEQFMASLTPKQIELAKRLKIEEGEG